MFVAGLGTSGTLMGVGPLPEGAEARRCRSSRSSRRRASSCRACATSTTGSCRRSSIPTCSTGSSSCGRASRSSGLRRLLDECGVFAGHLVGRGGRGRGEDGRARWTSGTIVDAAARRRVEVPVVGRVDRRPRRGRRARHAHQLLVAADDPCEHRRRGRACCAPAGWSRSRPRPCTGSAPTPANAERAAPPLRGEGPARRPSGDRAPRATPTQLDEWARDVPDAARALAARVLARPAHARRAPRAERVARRGDRWARHRRAARARPAGRARAARRVRRRRRGAVGQPLRPGEPDDRRRTCAPTSATTSTSCSTAGRAASASSRRSSTAPAPSPRSCASAA